MELKPQKTHKYRFILFVYIFGAFMDFISAIEMFTSAILGINSPFIGLGFSIDGDLAYRYIMIVAATFMLSWTILLIWGAHKPIERRALLIFIPVAAMPGLILARIMLVVWNMADINGIMLSSIVQVIIVIIFVLASIFASHIAKKTN